MDEKPDLGMCIKQISNVKKSLKLTGSPVKFPSLLETFGGNPEWLDPLLSQCKAPDAVYGEDMSDTRSLHSSRSRRSTERYRPGERYKTELCHHYAKSSCPKGDQCKFAHGERDPMAWCTICEKKLGTPCKRQVPSVLKHFHACNSIFIYMDDEHYCIYSGTFM